MKVPKVDNTRLIILLDKYQKGELTETESEELDSLYEAAGYDNGQLLDENDENVQRLVEKRYMALLVRARRKKVFRIWKHIGAAAAVLIILSLSGSIFFHWRNNNRPSQNLVVKNDIIPGHNGAILTLANGSKVVLDSAGNRTVAQQGGAQVINKNGQLIYHTQANTQDREVVYNSLSTPRGRKFELMLPDGSKVWLNSESSIRYPVAFSGSERKIEITGEAYFEVVHNSKMPFRVVAGNTAVEDIGTHFNINSYDSEHVTKTTLLEGSVKVVRLAGREEKILSAPGEQTQLTDHAFNIIHVNTDDVVAWKEGYFVFNNESLGNVMNKIARWYNVNIIFKDEALKSENTYGYISMFNNVSKVLNLLELTGVVKFHIEDNAIIVERK